MISISVSHEEGVRSETISCVLISTEVEAAAACVCKDCDWAVLLGGGVERRASSSNDWLFPSHLHVSLSLHTLAADAVHAGSGS